VAYTIYITELCLQFAASSEQEMEMSIDPAIAEQRGLDARIGLKNSKSWKLPLVSVNK